MSQSYLYRQPDLINEYFTYPAMNLNLMGQIVVVRAYT